MKTRIDLQIKLEELFKSPNVYYQPPQSKLISYPAIVYTKDNMISNPADNIKYRNFDSYKITVIDKLPDNEVIKKILQLSYTSFVTHFIADNLNHDVIRIYL